MSWSDLNRDLHYEYTRLLVKTLNNKEMFFLKGLRENIDDLLNTSTLWVNDNFVLLDGFVSGREWFEYFYNESELEMLLMTILMDSFDSMSKEITSFYNSGSTLAYTHMMKQPFFTESDQKALTNLNNYVGSVVNSINTEFADGIVKTIGKHIDDNTLEECNQSLINNRFKPLSSRFSTDTRCLFTTKTEYARAVNTGLLQAYSNYGVDNYDWITSGLPNTCKRCFEIEANSPYTLNEVINLMPVHPNCVCSVKGRLPNNLHIKRNPTVVDLTPSKEGDTKL